MKTTVRHSDCDDIDKLKLFFEPRSVAVIGASKDPAKPSGQPVYSLKKNGFKGAIYPVNPKYREINGMPCFSTLSEVPGPVDLAVVAVSVEHVLSALDQCADKDVRAVVVISSGFAETGEKGRDAQGKLSRLARKSGMRILGPNCMGIFNMKNNLTAGFALTELAKGMSIPNFLGLITQSGGFGVTIYTMARDRGIGLTHFISTGNEADVEFSEMLTYLLDDPDVRVVAGYLEGIRDGNRFARAAELALEAGKPLLVIKTGSSEAAARAAASHTGALVGSDRVYNAFFKQKGIIRVDDMEELAAELLLLGAGRTPTGKRVAVLASSGGTAVYMADRCSAEGLEVVPLSQRTRARLGEILPSFASTVNPVDITSAILVEPGLLERCFEIVLDDEDIDMLLVTHWAEFGDLKNLEELARVHERTKKPVMVVVWGPEEGVRQALHFLRKHKVPAVSEAGSAVRALGKMAEYYNRRQKYLEDKNASKMVNVDGRNAKIDQDAASRMLTGCETKTLTEARAKALLKTYGIPVVRELAASSVEETVRAAEEIGYPVVLKVDSPDILHKTEAGGVRLNLQNAGEVSKAFEEIMKNAHLYRHDARVNGVLVQEMLPAGVEVIVGVNRDPLFGATVLFGLGGIFVEALEDVSLRVAPLSRRDACEMVEEIAGSNILKGLRGRPPADTDALVEVILRVGRLALDFPEIKEMDINPLVVYEKGKGVRAADALVVLGE